MPSFAPTPFMESPTYIVPHPQIQAIDNRRLPHPQVHTPCAPYQNPNHTRRVRLPHSIPVRELTDSAVQTEPTQGQVGGYADGSPPVRLDSGHGTASNSPSSSTTSKNQGSAGVDNYEKSCVTATLEIQRCPKDSAGKGNVPPYRNAHCEMWSVGSPDSIVPVCSSSQQEDEVVKGRRVSFPNLLSWERGTPNMQKMSDEVLHLKENNQLSGENEVGYGRSVYRNPTGPQGSLVANIDEPNDDVRNLSLMFPDHEQEKCGRNSPEDLTEVSCYQMVLHNYQMKRKLNESIWSVESLVPFIPNKEALVQENNFESEKITEIREKAVNSQLLTLNDNASVAKGSQQGHITACVGRKNPFVSLTFPLCQTTLSTTAGEEVDNGFSELEVDQNPYQEPAIESKRQRKCISSKEKELLFLSFAAGEKTSSMGQMIQNGGNMEVGGGTTENKEASQLRNEQLCVPMSNAHLVNRSIQCSTILPCSHNCWGGSSGRHPRNYSGDYATFDILLYKMHSSTQVQNNNYSV